MNQSVLVDFKALAQEIEHAAALRELHAQVDMTLILKAEV